MNLSKKEKCLEVWSGFLGEYSVSIISPLITSKLAHSILYEIQNLYTATTVYFLHFCPTYHKNWATNSRACSKLCC